MVFKLDETDVCLIAQQLLMAATLAADNLKYIGHRKESRGDPDIDRLRWTVSSYLGLRNRLLDRLADYQADDERTSTLKLREDGLRSVVKRWNDHIARIIAPVNDD